MQSDATSVCLGERLLYPFPIISMNNICIYLGDAFSRLIIVIYSFIQHSVINQVKGEWQGLWVNA